MNLVFFGEELNARAPTAVGCLFDEDRSAWSSLMDVVTAMRAGEAVTVRQATQEEMKRAEALAEIWELNSRIAGCMHVLLENKGADVAEDAVFNLHQAIMAVKFPEVDLLDKVGA